MASEYATPPKYLLSTDARTTDDIVAHAARHPGHVAFSRKVAGEWRPVTSKAFADQVAAVAAGLIAEGIEPGDRVVLMSATRYEWTLCDFAIWTAGAVTVPIFETSSTEQIEWILKDSGAVAAFVESSRDTTTIDTADSLRRVWRLDGDGLEPLIAAGRSVPADEVERRRTAVTSDTPASIVYTSGTTGRPKGCVLTHGNFVAQARNGSLADGIKERVLQGDSSVLLFLPLAHVLARSIQLVAIHNGIRLAHTGDLKTVAAELETFRPTLILTVPRVFEKIYNGARRKAVEEGHGKVFAAAEATAEAYSRALDTGGPGPLLRLRRALFERLVYRKLRAAMGGRITWAFSGGAPLGARLGHFFRGAGITILEGWGLTETAAGATLNLPAAPRIGSVGRPLPGCALKIAGDGEVLVKSPTVFAGYWHDPEATETVFDEDGWFRTGDLGRLDEDGFLHITGRKKDLIITASGKNVAPALLEDRLRAHWLVDECVVVGDRRPFISALITVDLEILPSWKASADKPDEAGMAELRFDADLLAVIQEAVDDANLAVSQAEAIKSFRLLTDRFAIGGELTPTQKVRRDFVMSKFADEVEALYAGHGSGLGSGDGSEAEPEPGASERLREPSTKRDG